LAIDGLNPDVVFDKTAPLETQHWLTGLHEHTLDGYGIPVGSAEGEQQDRVFVLYGLRRTGKTTLLRQIVLDMTPEQHDKTAFIQVKSPFSLPSG